MYANANYIAGDRCTLTIIINFCFCHLITVIAMYQKSDLKHHIIVTMFTLC